MLGASPPRRLAREWGRDQWTTAPREFTDTSTCTHLNDVLRLLADVEVLVDELAR